MASVAHTVKHKADNADGDGTKDTIQDTGNPSQPVVAHKHTGSHQSQCTSVVFTAFIVVVLARLTAMVFQLSQQLSKLAAEMRHLEEKVANGEFHLSESIKQLEHRVTESEKVVAFFARKFDHQSGGTIIYPEVGINNNGGYPSGGYDASSGKFTAPVTGMYQLSTGGVSQEGMRVSGLCININAVRVYCLGADPASGGTSSMILHTLQAGDEVHIENSAGALDCARSPNCLFTGLLIKALA